MKTDKGAGILNQTLLSSKFFKKLDENYIKHIEISLFAAEVGSAWEILIRVLKYRVYRVIYRVKLNYFELLTTLTNIQTAINSRPQTLRANTDDLEVVTPNSFLKLHGNSSLLFRDDKINVWIDKNTQYIIEKKYCKIKLIAWNIFEKL